MRSLPRFVIYAWNLDRMSAQPAERHSSIFSQERCGFDMDKEKLQKLRDIVAGSRSLVFFGGAGVSTESGIPDFRSVDGLYRQSYDVPPETILSHSYFEAHPDVFFRFYREKMLYPNARTNPAHIRLAAWEQEGRLRAVITQNIDGLHQAAGSREVLELHGSVRRNHCILCRRPFSLEDILHTQGIPRCPCGGIIKPDVVLYEEPLDEEVLQRSVAHIQQADTLIVGGTSLNVYPAAGLLRYFQGNHLVIINREPTPADRKASLLLQGNIGEIFQAL